jgi:hypothetical protein
VRFRDRRLLSLLLVALASVAALALSACGGGGNGGSGDAKALLKDAFKTPINSANVSLDVSAKIDGVAQLSQPISLKLSGPYQSQGQKKVPKLDWNVNVSGGGQTFSGGLISTGDNAFVSFQGQNYEVGTALVKQYEQQLGTQQSGNLSFKQYGIDPANWLKDAKTAGDEDVAGTATTKVTGGVDVEKMLNDINTLVEKAGPKVGQNTGQKLTPEQINQVKQVVKNPTFEAFVAKGDKTLRRLTTSITFSIPQAQRQQASGATGGNVKFSIQFANVGQPAQVTAPSNPKPLSELQSQLGSSGLGGLGGTGGTGGTGGSSGSSGGSSGGGSGSSPSSAQFQKYADCLQKAGGNQAEVQKCTALIR